MLGAHDVPCPGRERGGSGAAGAAEPPEAPEARGLARAPNEAWSWDITRLLEPEKWRHFHLYVILDIFSRYVTGWMVAERETPRRWAAA